MSAADGTDEGPEWAEVEAVMETMTPLQRVAWDIVPADDNTPVARYLLIAKAITITTDRALEAFVWSVHQLGAKFDYLDGMIELDLGSDYGEFFLKATWEWEDDDDDEAETDDNTGEADDDDDARRAVTRATHGDAPGQARRGALPAVRRNTTSGVHDTERPAHVDQVARSACRRRRGGRPGRGAARPGVALPRNDLVNDDTNTNERDDNNMDNTTDPRITVVVGALGALADRADAVRAEIESVGGHVTLIKTIAMVFETSAHTVVKGLLDAFETATDDDLESVSDFEFDADDADWTADVVTTNPMNFPLEFDDEGEPMACFMPGSLHWVHNEVLMAEHRLTQFQARHTVTESAGQNMEALRARAVSLDATNSLRDLQVIESLMVASGHWAYELDGYDERGDDHP